MLCMKGVDILLIPGVSRHVQHTAGTRTARGGRRGALCCHDYSRFHFLLALPNLHNPSIIVSELFLVGQSPELMSSSTVQGSSFRRPKLRSCFSRFSIRGRFAPLNQTGQKRICPRTLRFTLRASRPHAQVQAATGVQALCCTLFLH